MRLLFVVHRYAPYPGGSEYFVSNMAEEALRRGHDVSVLTDQHKGHLNGVKVHSSYNELLRPYDLIIVHGADVGSQNVVHTNYASIKSPVLYMIIKPTESAFGILGLKAATFLGCSTMEDMAICKKYGVEDKIRYVRHGIPIEKTIFPKTWSTPFVHFISVGGFWPHKGMVELSETFMKVTEKFNNTWLHLYGYGPGPEIPYHPRINTYKGCSQSQVLQAISNSDVLVMNSFEEGFGLVLLEAMANKTPWFARDIAGASQLKDFGYAYDNQDQLASLMESYIRYKDYLDVTQDENLITKDVEAAYDFVTGTHSIQHTVDDIERLL